MVIYKITNNINDKVYIGKDEKNDDNYFGSGLLIKRAIEKYGKDNFSKIVLEKCDTQLELNYKEIFWINELNSISPNGYNLTIGGTGGDTFSNQTDDRKKEIIEKRTKTTFSRHGLDFFKKPKSEETKKKISVACTGLKFENRKSAILTEEHKNKISEANKGKKRTDDQKNNLSVAKTGTHHSEETKLKLSEKLKCNTNAKGYKHTEEAKKMMSEKKKGCHGNKGYVYTEEKRIKRNEKRAENKKNKNKNNDTV